MDDGFAKGQCIEDRGLDGELDACLSDGSAHETSNNVGSDAERQRRLASVSVFVHSSTEGSDSLDRVEGASYGEGGRDGPPSSASNLSGGFSKKWNSFHISHHSRKFPGRRWIRYQNAGVCSLYPSNVGVGGT